MEPESSIDPWMEGQQVLPRLTHDLVLLSVVTLTLGLSACGGRVDVGSGYGPVTRELLIGAEYHHPTGGKYGHLDWDFRETEFRLTTDADALPPALVEAIAGTDEPAREVTGEWELAGETLTFSNITLDRTTEFAGQTTARIFFTGVIRIQIAGTQYVFNQARPDQTSDSE